MSKQLNEDEKTYIENGPKDTTKSGTASAAYSLHFLCKYHGKSYPLTLHDPNTCVDCATITWRGEVIQVKDATTDECAKFGFTAITKDGTTITVCATTKDYVASINNNWQDCRQ
jgi:hypothetical protein